MHHMSSHNAPDLASCDEQWAPLSPKQAARAAVASGTKHLTSDLLAAERDELGLGCTLIGECWPRAGKCPLPRKADISRRPLDPNCGRSRTSGQTSEPATRRKFALK